MGSRSPAEVLGACHWYSGKAAKVALVWFLACGPAVAGNHWFSGPVAATGPETALSPSSIGTKAAAAPACGVTPFDLVVYFYDPSPSDATKARVKETLGHFADAVWEATECAHRLRNIRIFSSSAKDKFANIVWQKTGEALHSPLNGFENGSSISMYVGPDACCARHQRL